MSEEVLLNRLLSKFQSIVKSLSYKTYVNFQISSEDLEQELQMKLIIYLRKNLDLEELPEKKQFSLIKVILKNRTLDIIKHQARRGDTSDINTNFEPEQLDKIFSTELVYISSFFEKPHKSFERIELRALIKNWAHKQEEEDKIFMLEFLDPSPAIKKIWMDLQKTNRRCMGVDPIPIATLCRILNFDIKAWNELRYYLRLYLIQHGYRFTGGTA